MEQKSEDRSSLLRELVKKATEEPDTKKQVNLVVVPMPVKHAEEITVKDWLAKLDEEVNEFKEALLVYNKLDDELQEGAYRDGQNAMDIVKEGADVCTVIHSICERLGLDFDTRMQGQRLVNQKNMRLGRL